MVNDRLMRVSPTFFEKLKEAKRKKLIRNMREFTDNLANELILDEIEKTDRYINIRSLLRKKGDIK